MYWSKISYTGGYCNPVARTGALTSDRRAREMVDTTSGQPLPDRQSLSNVLRSAQSRAFSGGLSGAAAQCVNVLSLMWMRTTLNVQLAHGGSMLGTMRLLYREGGIPRFYAGVLPAMIQSPFARFGDTFANAGALAVCDGMELARH